jgi:predicted Zn-dependent protease
MRRFIVFFASVAAVMMVTACAKPTTMTPGVSKEEFHREGKIQEEQVRSVSRVSDSEAKKTSATIPAGGPKLLAQVAARITAAGKQFCGQFAPPVQGCEYSIEIDKDAQINAFADGKRVVFAAGMMEFLNNDPDMMATVMGHEYAHNLMRHIDARKKNVATGGLLGMAVDILAMSQGIDTGGEFTKIGAQTGVMTYSQDFEREADYVGLYIMHLAGYNIEKAPHLWRKMSTEHPKGIYTGHTHPANAERFVALSKTIAEIRQKEKTKAALRPEMKPKDD